MSEYRPVPEDRVAEFRDALHYAFSAADGPRDPDDEHDEDPSLFERRGVFADGDLVSACKHRWLAARVRGQFHAVAGLSGVATPPEHRRQGHVRRLLLESLREYRERDQVLSALWPFERGFYERFGWATANRYVSVTAPPESLAFAADAESGRFRRLAPDDWSAVDPVYDAHGEDVALSLDRSGAWWRDRVFARYGEERYAYGWERDGECRGYVVYDFEGDDGATLSVTELAYADRAAFRNLLRFLYNHDSQVDAVELSLPGTTHLLDVVDDPGEVDCELSLGPMVRVVDVRESLAALSYPADGAVTLSVTDPLIDRNDGTFELAVEGGEATCARVEADDPDVSLGVGALSQLAVGYRDVDALSATGDVELADAAAGESLAALFPERDVYLREFF